MEQFKEKWLVIGADGLIGRALSDYLKIVGKPVLETTKRPDTISEKRLLLDLAEDISDWQLPEHISVAYICAAVTSLSDCRKDPSQTKKINVTNTVVLARKLVEQGVFVVFPSTNLVYDGLVPSLEPDAPVCPKTEYGRQKAEAEKQLMSLEEMVAIVRFTKILGTETPLFKEWIKALKNNKVIHPFSDMVISPVPLSFAVEVLYRVAEKRLPGIVQVSGRQDVTYEQVALYIAKRIGAGQEQIQPIKAKESGLNIETLCSNTTLDISRLKNELKVMPPDVWKTIEDACEL